MLKEDMQVRQIQGDPQRRWFSDEYFDLIVWFEPEGGIWGFQLCYDRENKQRALTWTQANGYKHTGIDDGEHGWGSAKSSPVLTRDGNYDAPLVTAKFRNAAGELPFALISFILEKLREYKP